ncbi:hypothetical protein [Pseudomonas nitroreducens]|uniref:Uncharacterized protein n=1 Tax=Pseudomonas nitroreducens TaxID=46680 RepID=A0A2D0ADW1_PSENT|nr:hypothetical protein [Pseudomonas nitroreducens]OWP50269.1 hypothetical protein CEG18_11995 [Pseudomonas nitroreducens]
MPQVNVIKPFIYQEPGAKAKQIDKGDQLLSEGCAEHARKIGAVEAPAAAAATSGAEEPAPEAGDQSRPAKPRK